MASSLWEGVWPSSPQLKMLEGLLDGLLILDEGDDLHPLLALRTHQEVYLIDFLNQPGTFLQILVLPLPWRTWEKTTSYLPCSPS